MCVWVITVKRRNMDSEEGEVSDTVPPTQITGDPTEAAKPSPDKTEPSSRRRGSKRSVKTAVSSPDAGDSVSGVRVLRARGAGCGRTKVNESKNATCKQHPKRVNRGRGRPVGPRSKNTQPTIKKSTAKKASKHSLGPKPSKGRDVTQATTACKPEAELKALSCGGKETDSLRGGNDDVADPDAALDNEPSFIDDPNDLIYKPETKKEKPRRHTMSRQKEVKIEELEKEEDEDDIKKEESTDIVVQSEEPPRKRGRLQKDDKVPRLPKQRKKPPVQYVRCEIEGCGTVLAHPRYLQHHIKYQHLLKKKYVCDHPSCGRLFRLQKQLLRHAKHHTDQRDYICEYCARAFKSSHNLAVHRMIHTGEKPIQCEICGFTCRQKASLNWHMKKHDAESSYQFSCSICGKKFEKKDSVVAHKAKSHPEVLIAEALAANGGTVISTPTPTSETVPGVTPTQETVPVLNPAPETQSIKPSVSQENQEVVNSTLTPLQQVVLAPQTQLDGAQSQFLPLPTNQQQTPTLVHLSTPFSSINHPQLIQLSTLPSSTVTSMAIVDPQSTLLTLSSVTSASLAPQAMQWGRGGHEVTQPPGEGELWDRVVVGADHQDVGEMMWEGNEQKRKEEEGIVWEREGGRQILLQCAEVHGDSLM